MVQPEKRGTALGESQGGSSCGERSSLSLVNAVNAHDVSDRRGADSFPAATRAQPPAPNPGQPGLQDLEPNSQSDMPKPLNLVALTVNASLRSLDVDAGAARVQTKGF